MKYVCGISSDHTHLYFGDIVIRKENSVTISPLCRQLLKLTTNNKGFLVNLNLYTVINSLHMTGIFIIHWFCRSYGKSWSIESRPHLSTYVNHINAGRGRYSSQELWIWPRAAKHEQHREQRTFSFLLLDHLEIRSICECYKYQLRTLVPLRIAGKLQCKAVDNGLKQVQIIYLAVISYLDKLFSPA